MNISPHAIFPWGERKWVNRFQWFHLDVLERVCYVVQRRAVVSSELPDPICIMRRGLVSGRVCMSVHIFTARFQKRSCAVAMWASASATLVVRNVPTIACAPILLTRLIDPMAVPLKPCIQKLEA
jgi:hypothetical protein